MRTRGSQHGVTLLETLVAAVLLGTAVLMSGAGLAWSQRIEDRALLHDAAWRRAADVAESLRSAPFEYVEEGEAPLDDPRLPEGQLVLAVEEDEDLGYKKVVIEVRWAGDIPGSVSLTTAVGAQELYR
ncbi:MAG: hypothetical protein AAF533_03455 [Acidobacteriota bacterium]